MQIDPTYNEAQHIQPPQTSVNACNIVATERKLYIHIAIVLICTPSAARCASVGETNVAKDEEKRRSGLGYRITMNNCGI